MGTDASSMTVHPTTVRLVDGTPITIRPLRRDDRALLIEGFALLSPESRYRRFFAPLPRLNTGMLDLLTDVDGTDHFACVALTGRSGTEVPVAAGRYIRPAGSDAAELALTVVDAYQGRGVGSLIVEALAVRAADNGVTRLEGFVLAENRPMLALLRKAGAQIQPDGVGVYHFAIDAAAWVHRLRPVRSGGGRR